MTAKTKILGLVTKNQIIPCIERQWGGNNDSNTARAVAPPGFNTSHSRTDSNHQNNPSAPRVENGGWGNMNYSSSNETLIPTGLSASLYGMPNEPSAAFQSQPQSMPNVDDERVLDLSPGVLQNAVIKVQVEGIHYIAVVLVMVTPYTTQPNIDQMKQCGKMASKKIYEQI